MKAEGGIELSAGGHIALGRIGTIAKKVVFHLARQVLAGTQIGQVETVFIDQHGLVLQPVGPGLFAHAFPNAFAQVARVGGEVQTFGLLSEFDALNGACHGVCSPFEWGEL